MLKEKEKQHRSILIKIIFYFIFFLNEWQVLDLSPFTPQVNLGRTLLLAPRSKEIPEPEAIRFMEFPKLTRVHPEDANPTVRRFSVRHSPYERPEKDSVRKLLKIKKSVSTTIIIDKDPDYHDYKLVGRALTMIADEIMVFRKSLKMKLKR